MDLRGQHLSAHARVNRRKLDGAKVTLSSPFQVRSSRPGQMAPDYPETNRRHPFESSRYRREVLVKLYFDKDSGLLVRNCEMPERWWAKSTQVDYSDYRDVAGIKLPFHWELSWTDVNRLSIERGAAQRSN